MTLDLFCLTGKQHSAEFSLLITQAKGHWEVSKRARAKEAMQREKGEEERILRSGALELPQRHVSVEISQALSTIPSLARNYTHESEMESHDRSPSLQATEAPLRSEANLNFTLGVKCVSHPPALSLPRHP
ncbi:hypothetical protein JZ751_017834, partial [Albula glossodonta]